MEVLYIGVASLTEPAAPLSHRMGEGLGVRVQEELPGDRGPRTAGRRRLPQPRLREHPQDLPDASLQNHARPLGHGPDDVHQIHHRGDADVNVHNTSEVLFRLCANTDPQRDSLFTKGPSDVLDHATSEIASGSKLGIDATKKIAGDGFKRPWPPLIKMNEVVRKRIISLFGNAGDKF